MARINLITDSDPKAQGPLAQQIRAARRGGLINLYRGLLNAPDLAESWLGHLNTVRWKTRLPARLRELVIVRIGYICQADYIIRQHVPELALKDGVTEAECAFLALPDLPDCFCAPEIAALHYAEAVTRDIRASDAVFDALRPHFDDQGIVELTVLIGTYNMHVRFVRGLDIDLEDDAQSTATQTKDDLQMTQARLKVVVENDPFLRMVQLVLDPDTDPARMAAFADFFAHDVPDFAGWCAGLRGSLPQLGGARVVLVDSVEQYHAELPDAHVIVTEALPVGQSELDLAPGLKAVQKYGLSMRNIDVDAARARGIPVLGLRRRANIACAEHVMALMLTLAKRVTDLAGRISEAQMTAIGYSYRPFDRTITPGSNWARIGGIKVLYESTLGIIGMGEIGKELAARARAFGMDVVYHQRTPLDAAEESALGLRYLPLDDLLAQSDWVVPQLPQGPSTRHILNVTNLAGIKPGAVIVNVSRPDVIERAAVIDGLKSGRIGGFGLDPQYHTPGADDDALLALPNVVLTPHIAAQPRFNAIRDFEDLFTQLEREI